MAASSAQQQAASCPLLPHELASLDDFVTTSVLNEGLEGGCVNGAPPTAAAGTATARSLTLRHRRAAAVLGHLSGDEQQRQIIVKVLRKPLPTGASAADAPLDSPAAPWRVAPLAVAPSGAPPCAQTTFPRSSAPSRSNRVPPTGALRRRSLAYARS